jgi:hypothetical protein
MKILKIKVGSVYIAGKDYPVFNAAFQKKSKDGKTTYYETRNPVFVQELEDKPIKPATEA